MAHNRGHTPVRNVTHGPRSRRTSHMLNPHVGRAARLANTAVRKTVIGWLCLSFASLLVIPLGTLLTVYLLPAGGSPGNAAPHGNIRRRRWDLGHRHPHMHAHPRIHRFGPALQDKASTHPAVTFQQRDARGHRCGREAGQPPHVRNRPAHPRHAKNQAEGPGGPKRGITQPRAKGREYCCR